MNSKADTEHPPPSTEDLYAARLDLHPIYDEPSGRQRVRSEASGHDGAFAGFDYVSLDFSMLETIVRIERLDWKTALQNVKGVYLIVDKSSGKKYVGSAYNGVGIWSRWSGYVTSGHGWNVALVELLANKGVAYARENFRMTLLEAWPYRTEDRIIIGRETHWKEALLTRGDFGYNRN